MKTPRIFHNVSPKLIMTPRLRQALFILTLPTLSLKTYLDKHIEKNPLLQSEDSEPLDSKIKRLFDSTAKYPRFDYAYLNNEAGENGLIDKLKSPQLTLQQYLVNQLNLTFLNDGERLIAEEIIANIDNNGYLRIAVDELAGNLNLPHDAIEDVLKTIQEFEPRGVGARNLQECLLIQLKDKDSASLAYRIVESAFRELTRKKYNEIAKKLNIDLDNAKAAIKKIISLNPKPGAIFSQDKNTSITPDIIIKNVKNKFQIFVNEKKLPQLKVNMRYRKLLENPNTPLEIKKFTKKLVKDALWFIECVEQRHKNTLKVMRAILKKQYQAILKGLRYTKPLSLKDVSKASGLHLSTVGRIVSNKYIDTPQGVIKGRDLFGRAFAKAKGTHVSDKNILYRITKIIRNEPATHRLTDKMIASSLNKEGINISRRTISKYRNLLEIPPAFLR